MFIHVGERKTVSDKKTIGVFNYDTIKKSDLNFRIIEIVESKQCDIRTIVIDTENKLISSKVSPYTVIKRASIELNDFIWRKE